MRHGLRDVVETVQQSVLAPRIDLEGDHPSGRRDDRAILEIDRDAGIAGRGAHLVGQRLHLVQRQRHRQDAVLEAVAVEDVSVGGRDHRLHAHAGERPHRALAARPTAEVLGGENDRRAAIGLLVQHAVGVLRAVRLEANLLEAIGAEALAAGVVDQPLDPDDQVGIDVLAHQRRRYARHFGELFYQSFLTSAIAPLMAAA